MDFPVWYLPHLSGGSIIAFISVVHVFVAQLAVGGAFFLVALERKALAERNHAVFQWVQAYTRFFLLLTMVFGAVTGVGIWVSISLVSPAGILLLLHEFSFIWAAEWLFFLGEIITLILYDRGFEKVLSGKMSGAVHQRIGFVYGFFAFVSLFLINGIISFMLTPGQWLQTQVAMDGFFNPTFWPSLVFRFALSLFLPGLFGLLFGLAVKGALRQIIVRFCVHWMSWPLIIFMLAAYWYVTALPADLQGVLARRTEDMYPWVRIFLGVVPLCCFGLALLQLRVFQKIHPLLIFLVFTTSFMFAGSFEWIRESARRPWLVHGYMYSNGITKDTAQALQTHGFLSLSKWTQLRVAAAEHGVRQSESGSGPDKPVPQPNIAVPVAVEEGSKLIMLEIPLAANALTLEGQAVYGEAIFRQQCSGCHGIGGPLLDIVPRASGRGYAGIRALLSGQGSISPYMPPFFGIEEDKEILAMWLMQITGAKSQ